MSRASQIKPPPSDVVDALCEKHKCTREVAVRMWVNTSRHERRAVLAKYRLYIRRSTGGFRFS